MGATLQITTDTASSAEAALEAVLQASITVRDTRNALATLQGERAKRKAEALVRLCELDHPANAAKKFSVSQAEDLLQLDAEYGNYKARVTSVENDLKHARNLLKMARLVARLRVAEIEAEGGLQ